jgi:hypothetical protein
MGGKRRLADRLIPLFPPPAVPRQRLSDFVFCGHSLVIARLQLKGTFTGSAGKWRA